MHAYKRLQNLVPQASRACLQLYTNDNSSNIVALIKKAFSVLPQTGRITRKKDRNVVKSIGHLINEVPKSNSSKADFDRKYANAFDRTFGKSKRF